MRLKLTLLTLLITVLTTSVKSQGNSGSPNMRLEATGLKLGSQLPDSLEVYDPKGSKIHLTDLFKRKPVVIVSGCLTCPVFLRTYPGVEAVYKDYKEDVDFYYLYKILAHPENHGYIQPITIEERFLHIVEAKEKLQTKIPWLADPMTNEISSAFGLTPNSEFLFDKKGRIVYMNTWSDADTLRKNLIDLVGPVTNISTIESLHLPAVSPMGISSEGGGEGEGVVERITVDETLIPIVVQSDQNNSTAYVKLRAEVTRSTLQDGSGKLYLGFHLDPIHNVHWNNLVDPLKYQISVPQSVNIEESTGIAPTVNQPSDSDPREFFIEVHNWKAENTLPIEVTYYACDEEDKWCKLVVQNYTLILDPDLFAGGVIGRSFRGGRSGRSGARGMQSANMAERMMSFDENQDGLLSKEEVPERMLTRFDMIDANKDGFLSKNEIDAMRRR